MIEFIFDKTEFIPPKHNRGNFENKTILITGAAGSIGSALATAFSHIKNCNLLLLDHSEAHLFQLQEKLAKTQHNNTTFYLGDITDETIISHIFKKLRPDIVYHSAAYKHLKLTQEHTYSCLKTNTTGSLYIAKYAAKYNTAQCILVSTDKAANPINNLGYSKLFAEELFKAYNTISETQFCIIRCGNIPYSSGSLLPIIQTQIKNDFPINIRSQKAARYFIPMRNVIEALYFIPQHPNVDLYIPQMNAPINISKIATLLLKEYNKTKNSSSEIIYSNLLSGEKPVESLHFADETKLASTNGLNFYRSPQKISKESISTFLEEISPEMTSDAVLEYCNSLITLDSFSK